MTDGLSRAAILPEPARPDFDGLIAEGCKLAATVAVGRCRFLDEYAVHRRPA